MRPAAEYVDCYAIPGADYVIDVIDPDTGLTMVNGHTEEEIKAREPLAVRMPIAQHCTDKATRQHTPITWGSTSEAKYNEMLNVLPPIDWQYDYFLVGEPTDHDAETGAPRYQAYRRLGSSIWYYRYEVSSRPITRRELRAIIGRYI